MRAECHGLQPQPLLIEPPLALFECYFFLTFQSAGSFAFSEQVRYWLKKFYKVTREKWDSASAAEAPFAELWDVTV